jgi:hypothetical protein
MVPRTSPESDCRSSVGLPFHRRSRDRKITRDMACVLGALQPTSIRRGTTWCVGYDEIKTTLIAKLHHTAQAHPSIADSNDMPQTQPFAPPPADLPGKPFVPAWVPPPITSQTEGFATLKSIDLSKMDSDKPEVVQGLVDEVKEAIREDGFIFLENYGISYEQVSCR